MKEFIVVRHSDGYFITVDKQFETIEDARQYIRLAAMGDSRHQYCIYALSDITNYIDA